jgi:hypothetical protein
MASGAGSSSSQGTPQGDFNQQWSRLVAKAWSDDSLRQRLLSDPRSVMEENGLPIPPGKEVRIVENSENVIYLPLAAKPSQAELSEEELSLATGRGTFSAGDTCSVTYFPSSRPGTPKQE